MHTVLTGVAELSCARASKLKCATVYGCATTDCAVFSDESCDSDVASPDSKLVSFKVDRDDKSDSGKVSLTDDVSNRSFTSAADDGVTSSDVVACESTCWSMLSDLDSVFSPLHSGVQLCSHATTI